MISMNALESKQQEVTKVFVEGFGNTLTDENFKTWFASHYHGVQGAEVAKGRDGKSLGYGYVSFYRKKDADRAIYDTDRKGPNGRFLSLKPFIKSKVCDDLSNRNVFVKGFGETLNDKELRTYFRDYIGDVESAKVQTYDNGASRGYGYVSFYKCEDAVKAVRKVNGKKLHGKTLTVEFFKPKEQRSQKFDCNIYVKWFSEILDDEDLQKLFEIFGEIDSAKVERDDNGAYKCYGYVCFRKWQDAETAVHCMNGYKMGSKLLTVCRFESRKEREMKLKNRNLHIKNLHESITDGELIHMFQPYGEIVSFVIRPSPFKGVNQGCVCFETVEAADNAIAALNQAFYKGLKLSVSVLQNKESRGNQMNEDLPLTSKTKTNETSECVRTQDVRNAKKNIYKVKSKSVGNLDRYNAKPKIAAKFNQHEEQKKPEKYSSKTYLRESVAQDLNQGVSRSNLPSRVRSSQPTKKESAGVRKMNIGSARKWY